MICTTVTRPSDQRKTQLPITPRQVLGSRHTARELPLPAGLHLSPVPTLTSHARALTQLILHPLPSATPLCLNVLPLLVHQDHTSAPKGCHLFINLPPNPVSSPPLCSPSILRIFYHCTEIVIYVSFSSRD